MFFDESYSEKWYHSETVTSFARNLDALIVVGTALQTNLARQIVMKTLERQSIPVLEVNPDPCINKGFTIEIVEESEQSLPDFFDEWLKLTNKR